MATTYNFVNPKTEFFKPANGVKTTLITVPTGFRYAVAGIRVCASAGAAGTCAIIVERSSVEYTLNDALAISTGLPGDEAGWPLYMEAGDILKATPSTANQHVAVTYGKVSPTQSGNVT